MSDTTFGVPFFGTDQLVQVNPAHAPKKYHGVVYTVTSRGRTGKLNVAALAAPSDTLTGDPRGFIDITHPAWIGTRDEAVLRATTVTVPDLQIGMVVKVPRDSKLWVITGESGGKYRAFELGGSTDGRYLRGINPASATIIPLAELADHL